MNAFTTPPQAPNWNDRTVAPGQADALIAWLATHVDEANAFVVALNNLSTSSSSSTNLTIGAGAQSLTVDTGKSYLPGMSLVVASTASPSNQMNGSVTSYNATTGALVLSVPAGNMSGSGTFSAWTVSLAIPLAVAAQYLPLAGGAMTGALLQNFSGLLRSVTPVGGAQVREWGDVVAETTGNIEIGASYNCNLSSGVWGGRDVTDICWLAKWSDVGGVFELWFAPSATAGTVPSWTKMLGIDLGNGSWSGPMAPYSSPVRQTCQASPVDANGLPTFMPAASSGASVTSQNITSAAPLVVSAANGYGANGAFDRIGRSVANLTWAGLTVTNAAVNYGYVDVGADGTLTPGVTTLAPIYQEGGTPSVTNGQATFSISQMQMAVGNGTAAAQAYRVFLWQGTGNGTNVASIVAYGLNGRWRGAATATLPGTNTAITQSHNLGVKPSRVWLTLANLTTDAGYAVGDEIEGAFTINNGVNTGTQPFAFWRSTTGCGFSTSNAVAFCASPKSGGIYASLTSANWSYRLSADRGW